MKKKIIIQVELTAYVPEEADIELISLDLIPSTIKIEGGNGHIEGARVIGYCTTGVLAQSEE